MGTAARLSVTDAGFRAFLGFDPVELRKGDADSAPMDTPEGATRGRIRGFATTEHEDKDEETILQSGVEGLEKGTPLTLEHPKGHFNRIGEVVSVKRMEKGGKPATFIEADLFLTHDLGRKVWDNAVALKKADASYGFGFSVEGPPPGRDPRNPKIITKAVVTSVAVTMAPRNDEASWDPVLAKGGLVPPFEPLPAMPPAPAVEPESKPVERGLSKSDARLLGVLKGYGLTARDLAIARVAKQAPSVAWGDVEAEIFKTHANGGGK